MGIKEEIQGQSGYLKKVREKYMPNTKEMAKLALEKFIATNSDKELSAEYFADNADEILKSLFLLETEIFKEKNEEIMTQTIPFFYTELYKEHYDKYEETNKIIEQLADIYQKCKKDEYTLEMFIKGITSTTTPLIDLISFSQKQSAKCRVGETLQNHLANIFNKCNVPYDTQQQKIEGGTIMDFIIPNADAIQEQPDQVINIECQTTLKDRFRLTTGKSTDAKIKRYLATVTGAGVVTARDINDISIEKIKEIIMDNNVTLVVLKEVKDKLILMLKGALQKIDETENNSIYSVNRADLVKLIKLGDKKIISFSELIKRDINSTITYWG